MNFIRTALYLFFKHYGRIVDYYQYRSDSVDLDTGKQTVVATKLTFKAVFLVEKKQILAAQQGLNLTSYITNIEAVFIISGDDIAKISTKDLIVLEGQRYSIIKVDESLRSAFVIYASKASDTLIEEFVSSSTTVTSEVTND